MKDMREAAKNQIVIILTNVNLELMIVVTSVMLIVKESFQPFRTSDFSISHNL